MGFFKNLFFRSKHTQQPDGNDTALPVSAASAAPSEQAETQSGEACPLPEELEKEPETEIPVSGPEPDKPISAPRIHPAAWQVADCIETEYASPELCVRGFAEALEMNPTYLCRIFRASYQMSINDYINRTRIHHSLEYLEETDMPVEDIARAVGFENTKYFFVLFKNIMGTTPRHYRISFRTGMQ
ncbi:MAG TPA: helix-turn-helix transcriptional regulator [Candidatus Lachnoclostridium stercoravium]|uniref:Helix-turn-helix transcriptional regulator n=1 Tax=Candidatus Lachnoclostridium stercoravium TaxID=2838633 RepID=A0A9D2HHB6_9FIRM|nr:helix-turn-helix transcriptional regulator [Candidatus Lachnoclostridium stercoravium]